MIELPEAFKNRVKVMLKEAAEDFFKSYDRQPYKAIRVNTLKISAAEFEKISPFALTPVAWEPNGFYVSGEKAGKTAYHCAGLYYVQEPSAMSAAPLLCATPGERILDLCSAPGGKGTQLAQAMEGKGVIVLNEIDFSRAKILARNVERMGIKNALVTCAPPEKIAEKFNGYFDKALVDAPCSGEGMFLKEPNAVAEWSERNIKLCAARQKQILDCAARCLKPDGLMVYSTCTFAPEEDELQIVDFLSGHAEFTLLKQNKLYPHECRGEGHFAALLEKTGGEEGCVRTIKPSAPPGLTAIYRAFERECLEVSFDNLHLVGGSLYSLPDSCPDFGGLQVLRAGVQLGEFKGERFEPAHSLAMCLKRGEAKTVEVDGATALNYLKGLTFACGGAESGWRLVALDGFPLGWCKAVNGTAKNHLPKGIRI